MGDCAWLETASSHFIPELIGSMISTTLVMISLFFFNVPMTIAAVWVIPVAFFVVLGARPISHRLNGWVPIVRSITCGAAEYIRGYLHRYPVQTYG